MWRIGFRKNGGIIKKYFFLEKVSFTDFDKNLDWWWLDITDNTLVDSNTKYKFLTNIGVCEGWLTNKEQKGWKWMKYYKISVIYLFCSSISNETNIELYSTKGISIA